MDPKIASRMNDSILTSAMQLYAIDAGKITLLDGFESFIYEFERPDGHFILRLGHSSRRMVDHIRAEVDWINYLASAGVSVARAVTSANGRLVEEIQDGVDGNFLCTAFIKAPGGSVQRSQFNDRFYRSYGRLMGRMHFLAKSYVPSNPSCKRYSWDDPFNGIVEKQMPSQELVALDKYVQVVAHLHSLPCAPDGYGMIHQDAHPGNFFVDDNYTITLFDFDDCIYGHFIYDIAMVAFYVSIQEKDPLAFMGEFMPSFLMGYAQENHLDPCWLNEINWFMKLREVELFATILFTFGESPSHSWSARFLKGRREKIEKDVSFLNFDWDSLAKYL